MQQNAGRKAIDEKSRILERGGGRCLLAASQAYQKAFETTQKNHSLFTYYLLEGLKGKAKEAVGAITGDEDVKAEGRAQQRKGEAAEEATKKAKRRQAEEEARQAERERKRQELKDKGLLGTVEDTLPKL